MQRGGGRGGGGGGRGTHPNRNGGKGYDAAHSVPVDAPDGAIECLICAEPVRAFCVFSCGHHTCYSCGLRIHTVGGGGCPVCRVKGGQLPIITRAIGQDEEQYTQEEMDNMRVLAIADRKLKCVIDGAPLASEVAKLYEFLCPVESCWRQGQQDPFYEFPSLRDHLRIDHKLSYCSICVEHRSAFLCEQVVYGEEALDQHMSGLCPQDSASFTGHPPCKFCSKKENIIRFYDGEALLSHMQQNHFTCDVCNKGQYTFTFYDNRNKLNQHFERCHKICDHQDCQGLDLMLRVFANDFDLAIHRQRVHGVKAKLVLNQSSFAASTADGSGAGAAGSGGGGGGGGSGGAGAPATGSNTNVIQITFDHIFRRDTVEMLPTKASATSRQRIRRHKNGGGGGGGAKELVIAPQENGLPPHYHRSGVMEILVRGADNVNNAAAGTSSSSRQAQQHVDPSSPTTTAGATHAFGISESLESYNVKNKVPTDPREQERLLNELLSRELTSPVAYAHFRSYTKDFIESRLLTSQYYDLLHTEIFPNKRVFGEVFPLLVATVPNPNKKMALQEVWKMKMAPEQQRVARAREEDEKAKEAEEEKARQEALWRELHTGKSSNAKGKSARVAAKQNAWLNPGKVSHLQSGSPTSQGPASASSSPSPQQQSGGAGNSWASHAAVAPPSATTGGKASGQQSVGNVWGSGSGGDGSSGTTYHDNSIGSRPGQAATGSSSSPPPGPLGTALGSNDLFPSLPNSGVRGSAGWGGKKKAAPKKANAWFQK